MARYRTNSIHGQSHVPPSEAPKISRVTIPSGEQHCSSATEAGFYTIHFRLICFYLLTKRVTSTAKENLKDSIQPETVHSICFGVRCRYIVHYTQISVRPDSDCVCLPYYLLSMFVSFTLLQFCSILTPFRHLDCQPNNQDSQIALKLIYYSTNNKYTKAG
jgi:hypothetical protein